MRKTQKRALLIAAPVVGLLTAAALVVPAMAAQGSTPTRSRRLRAPRRHLQAARPAAQRVDRAMVLLGDDDRPVQLIIAGKAHPRDDEGKRLVQRLFG